MRLNEQLAPERRVLMLASLAVLLTSALNLGAPAVLGYAIDHPLAAGDLKGVMRYGLLLLAMAVVAMATQYLQTLWMGGVGQRLVYRLRGQLFEKLQDLPLAFFQRHQTGDLISRLANDTDKLASFFSQSLTRFVGSLVTMLGSAVCLLVLNPRLGAAALLPGLIMVAVTRASSTLVRRLNKASLEGVGALSAEVQESLENFKVIVAFDRRDFFRQQFGLANQANYARAVKAGLVNGSLSPFYGLCSHAGQLIALAYGLWMVANGQFTVGFLISYFVYLQRFYDPMRQLANLWSTFQGAMSGFDRIAEILAVKDHLPVLAAGPVEEGAPRLEFRDVSFGYEKDRCILHDVSFALEKGKTYAFVGPTGGGKTTTASLMARLFDPDQGTVRLDGRDLRSYEAAERAAKIGFILQEPFLFDGTVGDNVSSLEGLEGMFEQGLATPVEGLSLGQRQVVAFLRAMLRKPDLLILDEATANIDTVTERVLTALLERLPAETTRVVIAHRLNTIEQADAIFFVNAGWVRLAGSLGQAVAMLREERRQS
ncbi:MAG: ABC transporter ATP-binding protein [Vulcanimicrobiota bacterium]